jgi:hypothetical protein
MKTLEPNMKMLIEQFILDHQSNELEAVILTGSYATGTATNRSDVDLCYIGNFPEFKRECHFYKGKEFQIMIGPWIWYEDVVKNYEREGNMGTITTMLAKGFCIWGNNKRWIDLHQLALEYSKVGPSPVSEKQIRKIRVKLTSLWNDFCDSNEVAVKKWLTFCLVQECVDAQFEIRRWWVAKPKYRLQKLREKDSMMFKLVERCMLGIDQDALYQLCIHVLEPIGGWMDEYWQS